VELPFSGPVDEFNRRLVRNDYPVAAFWDIGVRDLRVPLRDLRIETTRSRMRDMVANGHRFIVFSAGAADAGSAGLIAAHRGLVAAWEVVLPAADLAASTPVLKAFRAATGIPVLVARMESTADEIGDPAAHGVSFKHHVTHGFTLGALEYALGFAERLSREACDGVVFRMRLADDPAIGLSTVAGFAREHGLSALVTVCIAGEGPDDSNRDDAAIARRVARAGFAARALPDVTVVLDTFMDMDRGYCTRHGLVDRRFNHREAGLALRHLNAVLATVDGTGGALVVGDDHLSWTTDGMIFQLLDADHSGLGRLPPAPEAGMSGRCRIVELVSGRERRSTWSTDAASGALRLATVIDASEPAVPVLVAIDRR
jgi:hypothetical protein